MAVENRASFEQWEQKFTAARMEVANEASRLIQKIQQEAEKSARVRERRRGGSDAQGFAELVYAARGAVDAASCGNSYSGKDWRSATNISSN